MRKQIGVAVVIIVGLFSAGAGRSQDRLGHYAGDSVFRGSMGVFSPRGESTYWDEKARDFFTSPDDYEDFTFAVDFVHYLSPRAGVLLSIGGWEGESTQSYRDFVDNFGNEISHVTSVSTAWFDVGMVFHLLDKRAPVMPYVGAGGSILSWELTEEGEFIDFGFDPPEVVRDRFLADGDGFGFFVLAGIEIPLSSTVALFAEGRWRDADVELGMDFAGFGTLDLSGHSLSAGLAFSF